MGKLIDVSVLKEWVENWFTKNRFYHPYAKNNNIPITELYDILEQMPAARPTLYGYNIEHLELIARVLQKEDLPPERVVEALTDTGRIVAIVIDEFEETLRRSVQNIERRTDEN